MPTNKYSILRVEKLKSLAEVSGSAAHMRRTAHAENADPARRDQNRLLVGSADPVQDVKDRLDVAWKRANSVLALEVLLTASPEFFETDGAAHLEAWIETGRQFLLDEFGNNLVHVELHLDEKTPHLTAFVVPVVEGRLNAKHYVGDKMKLRGLQDRVGIAFADFGLSRGVRSSGATHTTLKQFYSNLQDSSEPPPAELVPQLKQMARSSIENERMYKEATARLRGLPLQDVLREAGLEPSSRDRNRWVDAEGRFAITIAGAKWHCHKAAQGRAGAIDLVQFLLDCDFANARSWLASRFSANQVIADQVASVERAATEDLKNAAPVEFVPPTPVAANWSTVHKYLVEERCLDVELIDQCHRRGQIYADARSNAVFLAFDGDGKPVAAELRGTSSAFKGLALGSRKARGHFSIGPSKPKAVYAFESAIDALSLATYFLKTKTRDLLSVVGFVSTAGVSAKPIAVDADVKLYCAYDADPAGDAAAKTWPRRARPPVKDYNTFLTLWTQSERHKKKTDPDVIPSSLPEAPSPDSEASPV